MRFLVFLCLLFSCSGQTITSKKKYNFSVLQGSTDHESTVIRVVYPKLLKTHYEITDNKNNIVESFKVQSFQHQGSEFKVDHLLISKLKSNTDYHLKVSSPQKNWNETRIFKTLDLEKSSYDILIASCMSDTYNQIGDIIWPQAFSLGPDITFLIGDNLYADVYSGVYLGSLIQTSPDHLWARHVDHAMNLAIYKQKRLIPTFTIWDDHDYGINDGGNKYQYKKESLSIYQTFFPAKTNSIFETSKWGLSSTLKLQNTLFHFLDGRYYKGTPKEKNSHQFHPNQLTWLYQNIKTSEQNWIISGTQFFGGYHPYESFEGHHPEQFKSFIKKLSSLNKQYQFLSGDRHLIEVMKIPQSKLPKSSYEFTVSGVHSKMYPGSLKRSPNKYRINGFDGIANFGIINFGNRKSTFKAYKINESKPEITMSF